MENSSFLTGEQTANLTIHFKKIAKSLIAKLRARYCYKTFPYITSTFTFIYHDPKSLENHFEGQIWSKFVAKSIS